MARRLVGAALVASALTASCTPEPRDGQFTCSDGECPDGLSCCSGRCRRTCGDPADAEAPGDGGADAGPHGGADASTDGGAGDAGYDGGAACPGPCGVGRSCGPADACVDDDSVPSCHPCSRDVQCRGAAACIAEEGERGRCFPTVEAAGCEGPVYTSWADRATVEMEMMQICLPPSGVSCAAVLAATNENFCARDTMCPEGGACDVARTTCTYSCQAREDCIEGLVCVTQLCTSP